MQSKTSTPPTGQSRREMLREGIRTFSAAVGTTAVIMLTLCGILDTVFPNDEPQNFAASALAAVEEPQTERVRLGGNVLAFACFPTALL